MPSMELLVFYLILNFPGFSNTNYYLGPYTEQECNVRYAALAQLHGWTKGIECKRAIGYRTCNRADMEYVCPIFNTLILR
jgi:hypothetical protein